MPIPGQDPLVTINGAKEQAITFQPVLFAEIQFGDGTFRRLAPENFDSTEGGVKYKDHDWEPRLKTQQLGALQSVTDNGIVQMPQITLTLADADGFLFTEDELTKGYKGAKITLFFAFWDPDTTVFSTDEQVKFVGICNAPNADDETLTITATNILNLNLINLPPVRVGRLCPWIFPTTQADRQDAADNPDSNFYPCGYSPDATGPNAVGNMGPDGQPFTSCGFSWEECIARMGNIGLQPRGPSPVQIEQDTSGHHTARFGGIHYDPPDAWRGKQYSSGNTANGINDSNEGKFSTYFPLAYGTAFIVPNIMNVVGDPNGTIAECVICVGQIHDNGATPGPIQSVIVNDFLVPHISVAVDPTQLAWSWVALGARGGSVNQGPSYNGMGDPYGSLATIAVRVPIQVQDSGSIPSVNILTDGPAIRVWNSSDPTDFTRIFTRNPAWVLLDLLLTWCNLKVEDTDLQSFIDAAAVCDVQVTYTDLAGDVVTHSRYQAGLMLTQRRNAQDIINNLLQSFKAVLAPSGGVAPDVSGKLQLFIKQTLEDQQPDPFDGVGSHEDGSNDVTPYDSAGGDDSDGSITTGFGYVAYSFNESNILRVGDRSTPSTFKLSQRPISDTPNRVGLTFQDQDYSYAADSLVVVDSGDVSRTGQQVNGGVVAEGICNFDQAKRAVETQLAEQYRGNPRGGSDSMTNDSGGTWRLTFDVSFRAIHLRIGHIIAVSYTRYGLDHQLFRVMGLSPSQNWERVTIVAQWHEDDWYLDSYGQNPDPLLQAQRRQKLLRPPFGWLPNQEAPIDHDAMYDKTEKSFSVAQIYYSDAAGNPLCSLVLVGHLPQNVFSKKVSPPYAPGAEVDLVGGAVKANEYWLAIVALDSDGVSSPPSSPLAHVTTTGSTGALTLSNIYWQPDTAGYRLFAGTNPNKLSLQAFAFGTPDSVSLPAYKVADEAMPDVMFDHLDVRVKHVEHSGVFGAQVIELNATTLKLDALGFDVDQFAGYPLTVMGIPNSSDPLPIIDLLVTSNTSDTFTIGNVTDMTGMNIGPSGTQKPGEGAVVVMRALANVASATTIGDPNFINAVKYFMPPISILDASDESPITLTLSTPYAGTTGDEVFVQDVKGNLGANGLFGSITVIDPLHIQLDGSTGTGGYTSGGKFIQVTHGLRPHEEIGRIVMIIAGTGRGQQAKIVENDETTLTIDGEWGVVPDVTSVFIVVDSTWLADLPTSPVQNADPATETTITIPVSNFDEEVLWVQAFSESGNSAKESLVADSPGREIYVFGGPGNQQVNYYPATWNLAVVTALVVADDIAPHYIVRRAGSGLNVEAKAKIPSSGADIHLDIIQTKFDGSFTGSIFKMGGYMVVPAGSDATTDPNVDFIDDLHFDEDDVLTVNCLQIGSGSAGQVVTLVLKIKVD